MLYVYPNPIPTLMEESLNPVTLLESVKCSKSILLSQLVSIELSTLFGFTSGIFSI